MLADPLQKTKKEFKNLKKKEIQTIFTKMKLIRLVFNMTWLMEILNIYQEEQILIKFYKSFNVAKNPNYDGHQRGLTSMVYKFLDKKSALLTDKSVAGSSVNMHANNKIKENHN